VTIWPRMLKRKTAAQYCDLSEAAFEKEVIAGRLPAPVMLGGREHWCKPDDQCQPRVIPAKPNYAALGLGSEWEAEGRN